MSVGPFRDTLTPLIDEARRQLAELQQRRAALEIRYEDARKRLDAKTQPAPPPSFARHEAIEGHEILDRLGSDPLKKPFIAGLVVGLLSWFLIFQDPH